MSKKMRLIVLFLILAMVVVACRREEEPEAEPTEAPAAEATEAPAEPTEAPAEPTEAPDEEPEMAEDMGPIKLAFLGPTTGPAAPLGQEMAGFAKVAVDIFNEETGLNVEYVEGDTEINPDVGKIVAEQLVADEDIYVVVGPAGSQVCESTQPVFEEAGLAHLTPSCTATFLTDPGTPTFFRPIATEAIQSRTIADVMLDTLGVESVYLIDDQSTYAVLLNDELEGYLADAGVTTERASISQEETDMSSLATAAIASGADTVFFASQAPGQLGTTIAQLREQGFEGHFFMPDGGFSPEVITTGGEAAEGTYVTSFAGDPNVIPSMAPYNERFAAEYTEEFGSFGGSTAMTTYVALQAIESCHNAGTMTRACVVETLTNINLDSTPMEVPVTFGAGNQNEAASFALFQIQNGAFQFLAPGEAGITVDAEPLSVDVPIKVAFLGPTTGPAAPLGQEMAGFAKVAVDIFNERTGLSVEYVEGDTEINPDVGKIVAEQLAADEDVYVVIGPAGSQVCESTQPVFEEAGLAHLTPSCTATFLTDPGTPTFFRPIATEALQSRTIADVMIEDLGVESVYLIDDQSTYAVLLNDELEEYLSDAGVTTERASISQEETDMSSLATAAIASGADTVFFASQAPGQLGTTIAQLREQGFEGNFFMPDGGFSPEVITTGGEAAEGTYVTSFAGDPNVIPSMAPYNERFVAEYTDEFGSFGGSTAMTTYVALRALESCIRAGDISRACIVETLTDINLATTPMGVPVTFGPGNQNELASFALFQIQDGSFVYIGG